MPATIFSILCRVPASWPVVAGVEENILGAGVVVDEVEAMAAAMAAACRAN